MNFSEIFAIDLGTTLGIILRTLLVYIAVVAGLRIFGKRELGQMTPFDLVLLLTLSNAVQNAMTGGDNSLTGGLLSAATLLAVNWVRTKLGFKLPGLRKYLVGEPRLLVHNGDVLLNNLRAEGLDIDDILEAAREHGIGKISEIGEAMLEVDGTISIIPSNVTPLRSKHRKAKR
ncbi:MAG: YetF domain-containing protein [Chloroflexia bacterium]